MIKIINSKNVILGLFLLLLVSVLVLTGCKKSSDSSNRESAEASYDSISSSINDGRKKYFTVNYKIETDDANSAIKKINKLVTDYNGYIEESNYTPSDNKAYYTLRIPTEKLDEFMSKFEDSEGVAYKSIEETDVTSSYIDTEARIETLESRINAYKEMLEKDNLTVQEVITINDKIDELNVELTRYKIMKEKYDDLVEYSQVHVSISESNTMIGGFFNGYGDYILGFLEVLLVIILVLLPFALVGGGITFIIIFSVRKKKQKKMKNESNNEEIH